MSAGASGAIGPVSVRYAAQIRELLFAQAMQRMAADQEAARARESAEAAPEPQRAPLKARVETPEPTAAGPNDAALEGTPAPTSETPHLVDVQA